LTLTEKDIVTLLDEHGFDYRLERHEAIFSGSQLNEDERELEGLVKCLFVRNKKKSDWFLVVVPLFARLDLSALGEVLGCGRLGFASEDDLWSALAVKAGSVNPFALAERDNAEPEIRAVFDQELIGGSVGVHPMHNEASVFMACEDLLNLLLEHGIEPQIIAVPKRD